MSSAGQLLVAGRIPGERIATSVDTADSATFTTIETVVGTVTAALVGGRTYRVRWVGSAQSTVADTGFLARIREDSLTGVLLVERTVWVATTTSSGVPADIEVEYAAVASGNKTFVATGAQNGGTGTLHADGLSTRPRYLYVDYIRG